MRRFAIREHLKFLFKLRNNWDFFMKGYEFRGFSLRTRGADIHFRSKDDLSKHIERTKLNLKRAR